MNIFMDEALVGTDDDGTVAAGTPDAVADVNVPEPAGTEKEVEGGNTLESEGLTNEEAGLE